MTDAAADPDSQATLEQRALEAFAALALEHGWRGVTMAAVAREAGLSFAALYRHFPDKTSLLRGLSRRIDAAVLEDGAADPAEPARDRLFEVMMRRYDALLPWRDALARLAEDLPRDPLAVLALRPAVHRSMAAMLEAAGIDSAGLVGTLRVNGLAALHAAVMRVWFTDDTADLSRTMAALDRRLKGAERWARRFGRLDGAARRRRRRREEDGAETGDLPPPVPDHTGM